MSYSVSAYFLFHKMYMPLVEKTSKRFHQCKDLHFSNGISPFPSSPFAACLSQFCSRGWGALKQIQGREGGKFSCLRINPSITETITTVDTSHSYLLHSSCDFSEFSMWIESLISSWFGGETCKNHINSQGSMAWIYVLQGSESLNLWWGFVLQYSDLVC